MLKTSELVILGLRDQVTIKRPPKPRGQRILMPASLKVSVQPSMWHLRFGPRARESIMRRPMYVIDRFLLKTLQVLTSVSLDVLTGYHLI